MPYDIYDTYPPDMARYLRANGWTFSRKACDYAVGKLGLESPWPADKVDEALNRYGLKLTRSHGHDRVWVANMARSDFYKSSLPDEKALATYIADVINDKDAGDGEIMRCWYAKMVARGEPVDWDEML